LIPRNERAERAVTTYQYTRHPIQPMKRIPFPKNERNFQVEYHKTREGPNGFMCYYKNAATYRLEPLDAWRTLGVAKFTDTGKELKAWCIEMDEQHKNYGLPDEVREEKFFDVPSEK